MPAHALARHGDVPENIMIGGAARPKPIPLEPVACRGCGKLLEPLRRWGGLCRECVCELPHASPRRASWELVRTFKRKRSKGKVIERCVLVRCSCGNERVLTWTHWTQRRPTRCKRCSLSGFDVRQVGQP